MFMAAVFSLCSLTVAGQDVKRLLAEADHGNVESMLQLGEYYLQNEDDKQAAHWFAKAADKGNTKAEFELGQMYWDGKGVSKDTEKAVNLWAKAAGKDYGKALFALGYYYYFDIKKDPEKAFDLVGRSLRAENGKIDDEDVVMMCLSLIKLNLELEIISE